MGLDAGPRGGQPDVLRSILWDLAQSDFQQESSRVAETLQNHLDRALRRPSRGVKQAPFYVLGGAAMPAVLVEIGFISNPQEEQRLRDDGYRDRIARALSAGIAAYKRSYDQRVGAIGEAMTRHDGRGARGPPAGAAHAPLHACTPRARSWSRSATRASSARRRSRSACRRSSAAAARAG